MAVQAYRGDRRPARDFDVYVFAFRNPGKTIAVVECNARSARQAADEVAADYFEAGDVLAVSRDDPAESFQVERGGR